jgi:RNA 2',3'-cyclic 3'-phosphodiesterase
VRLFVALDIPEAVRDSLARLRARFEQTCRAARWVRLEGMHLTLKFIGEVPAEQLEAVRAALRQVRAPAPIELRFAGLGFFPNERRPRVFWAGIDSGSALAQLAAAVEAQLAPLGIPPEARAFRPHLTLARFDSPEGVERMHAAAAEFAATEFGRMTGGEFYLYQSVLKRGGAEYTRLATYTLGAERAS